MGRVQHQRALVSEPQLFKGVDSNAGPPILLHQPANYLHTASHLWSTSRMVKKLPRLLLIFSLSTFTKPLCTQ